MKKSHFLSMRAITSNTKYERNSSAFQDNNSKIWMFYARADTITQRSGSDIDNESYMIYYRTSSNKAVSWSDPTLLNKTRPTGFNQRDLSALQDGSGKIWVFASSGDSGTYRPLIKYGTTDQGTTWSDAASITIPGEPTDSNNPLNGTRLGHSHVVYSGGKFHLVFQSSGGSTVKYSSSSDTVTWSSAVTIHASSHYVPKILVEGSNLFVVTAKGPDGEIWLAKSSNSGSSWTSAKIGGSETSWNDWDPFIARLPNNDLGVVWAPNIGSDGQQLKCMVSSDEGDTWSSPINLTEGKEGAEEWWDYWPQILTVQSTPRLMIFFTSERNASTPEFNGGNIWIFPPLPEDQFRPDTIFATGRSVSGNNIYDRFLS